MGLGVVLLFVLAMEIERARESERARERAPTELEIPAQRVRPYIVRCLID